MDDYRNTSSDTLRVYYGRHGFSEEERKIFETFQSGESILPTAISLRKPLNENHRVLIDSGESGLPARISARVIAAVSSFMEAAEPELWISQIDLTWPERVFSYAVVRVKLKDYDSSKTVTLRLQLNLRMPPYVGPLEVIK